MISEPPLKLEHAKPGYNDFTVVEAPASSGASQAIAMIKAFSSSSAGTRRWMTAPAPGLATIREDSDGDEPEQNVADVEKANEREGPGRSGGFSTRGTIYKANKKLSEANESAKV